MAYTVMAYIVMALRADELMPDQLECHDPTGVKFRQLAKDVRRAASARAYVHEQMNACRAYGGV